MSEKPVLVLRNWSLVIRQILMPAIACSTRTRVRAYRLKNGAYMDATDAILGNVDLVAPTRVIPADFNGDGWMDLLLTGSGTDAPPFPGEQAKLLLNDQAGHLVDQEGRLHGLDRQPHDSVVASGLADLRPELIDRMILMGVMQKTRKSWRMLLEESLFLMQEQRMEEFGQAVILYLVNHAKLDVTRMSPTAKRLFFRQMADFTATEQERYEINCNRLLRLTDVPIPSCKVLVACGQYDSFTLPHENANFAVHSGEIVGVAGVSGNGQRPLARTIAANLLENTCG